MHMYLKRHAFALCLVKRWCILQGGRSTVSVGNKQEDGGHADVDIGLV